VNTHSSELSSVTRGLLGWSKTTPVRSFVAFRKLDILSYEDYEIIQIIQVQNKRGCVVVPEMKNLYYIIINNKINY
jgi:hypothetical protein